MSGLINITLGIFIVIYCCSVPKKKKQTILGCAMVLIVIFCPRLEKHLNFHALKIDLNSSQELDAGEYKLILNTEQ